MIQEKKNAIEFVDAKADLICCVADQIWDYAELSLQEEKSAKLYCEVLEKKDSGWKRESAILLQPFRQPTAADVR